MITDIDLHIAYAVNEYVDYHIREHGYVPSNIGQHIDRVCHSMGYPIDGLIPGEAAKRLIDEVSTLYSSGSEVKV